MGCQSKWWFIEQRTSAVRNSILHLRYDFLSYIYQYHSGATGLAQVAEVTWQLRGQAGKRQVPHCKVGLTHNVGLGGAVVVSVLRRMNANLPYNIPAVNPAVTADSLPDAKLWLISMINKLKNNQQNEKSNFND